MVKGYPLLHFAFVLLLLNSGIPAYPGPVTYPSGEVIGDVTCKMDTTQSYSLYLPSYYDENEAWPVIYVFDPAARGELAVRYFQSAAEKYGYILAGSNNSENGPWENFLHTTDMMLQDTRAKFSIDSLRMYSAGFSGGARNASSLSVLYKLFKGVIGCGAGFSPNYPPRFDLDIHYFGLIGNTDYNYQEMKYLDLWLEKFDIDHDIEEFPGGHEWPPSEYLENAVLWLDFRAMEYALKPKDYYLLIEYHNEQEERITSLENEGSYYDAFTECNKTISFLNNLWKLDDLEALRDKLKKNEQVVRELELREEVRKKEKQYISAITEAFMRIKDNFANSAVPEEKNSWWKKQVKMAENLIEKGRTPQDTLLGRRLNDFIWRTAYVQYNDVMGTEFETLAEEFLSIWIIAQPQAVGPRYLLAEYYAGQGKDKKAILLLEDAIGLGFNNVDKLESDPVFTRLQAYDEYNSLLAVLRSNRELE